MEAAQLKTHFSEFAEEQYKRESKNYLLALPKEINLQITSLMAGFLVWGFSLEQASINSFRKTDKLEK